MDAHIKLKNWWVRTDADVTTAPATPEAVNRITRDYDLTLPTEFLRYLTVGLPTSDNWDDKMGNWWPIDRIRNVPSEYEHPLPSFIPNDGRRFLFFLDHCIWCWAWAISCEDDETFGKIALIGGQDERFVANTFAEFVDLYTSDWLSVS